MSMLCKRLFLSFSGLLAAVGLFLLTAIPVPAAESMDHFIFVASRASPEIAVIDTRKDEVVSRIASDSIPLHLLASKEKRRLITTSKEKRSLAIIDFDSRELLYSLRLGFVPAFVQLGPDEHLIAVGGEAGGLAVVSLETGQELHRIEGLGETGYAIFSAKGDRLFVSHRGSGEVSIVDLASGEVSQVISLKKVAPQSGGVAHITRTPGGRYGFALHRNGGGMTILDLKEETALAAVDLPGGHWRGFPTVDSQYVLVPNSEDDSLSVVSTRTRRESARFEGIRDMTGVNTALFGSVAFAFSRADKDVTVIDLQEQRVIDRFALPAAPETAATTTDGLKLYVALLESDQVAVIDVIRSRLVKTIDGVGGEPWAVFAAGGLNYCH